MIDIPAVYHILPVSICFVVKQELSKIPLFGRTIGRMGMLFVDRSNPKKAYESLARGAQLIQSGTNVMAFPEGTRNRSDTLRSFKKGIFVLAKQAQVPIVPMAIEGAQDVLTKSGLMQKNHQVYIKIGAAIEPDIFAEHDEISLAAYTRQRVCELHESIDKL